MTAAIDHQPLSRGPDRRASWLKRSRSALVAAGVGLVLTIVGATAVSRWEDRVALAAYESAVQNQATGLQNGINEYLQRLAALRTLFESVDEEITRNEFEFFTAQLFADHPGVRRVSWVPRVRRKDRAEYEQKARQHGIVGYRFQMVTEDGSQVTAPDSDEYYPAYYSTEPVNSAVYGLDLASNPERRATLERARDENVIAVLPSTELRGARGVVGAAALVVVPIYVKGTSRDTIADRRRNIAGFIVGRFEFNRLIESVLFATAPSLGAHLDIADPQGGASYRFFPGQPAVRIEDAARATPGREPAWSGTLHIGDASWAMSSTPPETSLASGHDRAIIVAIAGLVVTVILVAYVFFTSRHSRLLALAHRRVHDLAQIDALTGLANRAHFMARIEDARTELLARGTAFGILMLDLDRFKEVNDMHGHAAGDALLREVGRRLQAVIGGADILGRIGGDEFAILHVGAAPGDDSGEAAAQQKEDAQLLSIAIIEAFKEPVDLETCTMVVSTSIGIALAPADGAISEELLKKADLALYESKSIGRNRYCFFDPRMTESAAERHRLKADMRIGIERGEFTLLYQPFVEAATRRVVGAEALVRWHHPVHGLIMPDRFIPIAEESGLIVPLGNWVLHRACVDAASWPDDIKIAVNLSAAQFRAGSSLLDAVVFALVASGLAPQRLEVEVTETVLLERELDYLSVLHQLKNIEVSVALDDFGTGYSSLSYLKLFPFDKIKIDRSFIRDITERADCAAIVNTVANLGRSLDIVTTAEGVETEQQYEIVRAAGVTLAQGFLFGRPQPQAELPFYRAPEGEADRADSSGRAA